MPRANRRFLPGFVWHVTHRCHDRQFLLKAVAERDRWRAWLYRSRVRYGLCVLDYTVTSNHVHLLVFDEKGDDAIARSMQLMEGQTARSYNRRKGRHGAFWEDRYHAVAVDNGRYLWRCLAYIDLNMVRAGVVTHPCQWRHGGYGEIQSPRSRYRVLDLERLAELTECTSVAELRDTHRDVVESSIAGPGLARDPDWTEAIAVGGKSFTDGLRARLGLTALARSTRRGEHAHVLREPSSAYVAKRGGEIRF